VPKPLSTTKTTQQILQELEISLANSLTRGDISEAAFIIQQMRSLNSAIANQALSRLLTNLQNPSNESIQTQSPIPSVSPTESSLKEMPVPPKPIIDGEFVVGSTLNARWSTSISGYDGVTYRWLRGCNPSKNCSGSFVISGATSSSYNLTPSDLGWGIFVNVKFSKSGFIDYETSSGYPGISVINSSSSQTPIATTRTQTGTQTPTPIATTPTQTPTNVPLYWVIYPDTTFCPNQPFEVQAGFGGANARLGTGLNIQFNFNGQVFSSTTNQEGKASYSYTPSSNVNTIKVYASYGGGSAVRAVQSTTRSSSKSSSCTLPPTRTDLYVTSDSNFRAG
jgi:hypothetical protein